MATTGIDEKKFRAKLKLAVENKGDLRKLKSKSLNAIADSLIKEIKDRIAAGISPITGKRFQSYKNPKKYPGNKKPSRPVNLYLSGDFLRSLRTRFRSGKNPIITVYFTKALSELKEQGHREGANGQRKRPIIPQGKEGFTDGILTAVRKVFRMVLDKDLK
jgi:hypothetical protein